MRLAQLPLLLGLWFGLGAVPLGSVQSQHDQDEMCTTGGVIEHSNRIGAAACVGSIGQQCSFSCDDGYLAVGRHVCQTYSQGGQVSELPVVSE